NDNEELHNGTVWVCEHPRAQPRAVMRARSTRRLVETNSALGQRPALASEQPVGLGQVAPLELALLGSAACETQSATDPFVQELSLLVQPFAEQLPVQNLSVVSSLQSPLDGSRWDEFTALVSDYRLSLGQ